VRSRRRPKRKCPPPSPSTAATAICALLSRHRSPPPPPRPQRSAPSPPIATVEAGAGAAPPQIFMRSSPLLLLSSGVLALLHVSFCPLARQRGCLLETSSTQAVVSSFANWSWSFWYGTQSGVVAIKCTASLLASFLRACSTMHRTYSLRARGRCALGPVRTGLKQKREPIFSLDKSTANKRQKGAPTRQPQW